MAKQKRYYLEDDAEAGITRSQLKKLGRQRQIAYMQAWFRRYFEDPAHETPYESAEGGYLYIWGGPYDAHEELEAEFGQFVPFGRIDEAARELERGGLVDWAPTSHHPSRKQDEDDRLEVEESDSSTDDLDSLIADLEAGAPTRYGDEYELSQRRMVLDRLQEVERECERLKPTHGGIGHNRPPPDEIGVARDSVIAEAGEDAQSIRFELQKKEPDARIVARAASRLKALANWVGKKIDKGADAFMTTLGAGAAAAAISLIVKESPAIADKINQLLAAVTKWLATITVPF